jgi:hypothetical protein
MKWSEKMDEEWLNSISGFLIAWHLWCKAWRPKLDCGNHIFANSRGWSSDEDENAESEEADTALHASIMLSIDCAVDQLPYNLQKAFSEYARVLSNNRSSLTMPRPGFLARSALIRVKRILEP